MKTFETQRDSNPIQAVTSPSFDDSDSPEVKFKLDKMVSNIHEHTDRLFAKLMVFQWFFGIVCAFVVAPRTWEGDMSKTHLHVWSAVLLGGIISFLPVFLAIKRPGWVGTRHTIALTQGLWSALLIHLTGGRIETHFHVFGSLAFLAFYRDWRVLITMSAVVAVDHLLRGMFWPVSVYGLATAGEWRWLEHAGWVVFEDFFLISSCLRAEGEMSEICHQQVRLEKLQTQTEMKFDVKSQELENERERYLVRERYYIASQKEFLQTIDFAGQRLLEPMRVLVGQFQVLSKKYLGKFDKESETVIAQGIEETATIRRSINDINEYMKLDLESRTIVESSGEAILSRVTKNLKFTIDETRTKITNDRLPSFQCDLTHLTKVFQNIIGNAIAYRKKDTTPEIHISMIENESEWIFSIRDNGVGIPKDRVPSLFNMFERTKHQSGRDLHAGVGLPVCRKIIEQHGGKIWVESEEGKGSTFRFSISKVKVPLENNINNGISTQHVQFAKAA